MLESSSLSLAVKGVDQDDHGEDGLASSDNGEVKLGSLNRTVITQLANE